MSAKTNLSAVMEALAAGDESTARGLFAQFMRRKTVEAVEQDAAARGEPVNPDILTAMQIATEAQLAALPPADPDPVSGVSAPTA